MNSLFGGGVWPVLQRELRVAARWRWSYWLRVGGALGGVMVFWSVAAASHMTFGGLLVVEKIHLILLGLICLCLPALTADCIAGERRAGTLGLLFLTPLTATGIVLGKVLANTLRALTLWLAVLPLLVVPFLAGGLTLGDVAGFFVIELCAGMLCLAAGLLASSLTENFPLALVMAFLLLGAFVTGTGQHRDWWMRSPVGVPGVVVTASGGYLTKSNGVTAATGPISITTTMDAVKAGFFVGPHGRTVLGSAAQAANIAPNGVAYLYTNRFGTGAAGISMASMQGGGSHQNPLRTLAQDLSFVQGTFVTPNGITYTLTNGYISASGAAGVSVANILGVSPPQIAPGALVEDFLMAALILLTSFRVAGWCVELSWQDDIPTVRLESRVQRRCPTFFDHWFAHRRRRTLEWNPIAWLPQFSWRARLSKWGLCLLVVALEGADFMAGVPPGGVVTIPLLIFAVAYTAAAVNGFLQDKKSGALELVLVAPLSVKQIIFGRVWGLWQQFLPSVAVLLGCELARQWMHPHLSGYTGAFWEGNWGAYFIKDIEVVAVFLTLPVIAACFALTAQNLFMACAMTVAMGFGPAVTLWGIPLESDYIPLPASVLPAALGYSLFLTGVHVGLACYAFDTSRQTLRSESKVAEEE